MLKRHVEKKHTKTHKSFTVGGIVAPLSPNTKLVCGSFPPSLPLLSKSAMTEHSVIATVARRVDAMMLFLSVWTARIPFFNPS